MLGGGHREGDEDVDQRSVGGGAQRESGTLPLHTRRVYRQVPLHSSFSVISSSWQPVLRIRTTFVRSRIRFRAPDPNA